MSSTLINIYNLAREQEKFGTITLALDNNFKGLQRDLQEAQESILDQISQLGTSLDFMTEEEVRNLIDSMDLQSSIDLSEYVKAAQLHSQISSAIQSATSEVVEQLTEQLTEQFTGQLTEKINASSVQLSSKISAANASIANLSSKVDGIQVVINSDIADLKENVSTLSSEINGSKTDISNMSDQIQVLSSKIDDNKTDISNMSDQIRVLSSEINGSKTDISNMSDQILTLSSELTDNWLEMSSIADRVLDLGSEIIELGSSIDNIQEASQELLQLSSNLDDLIELSSNLQPILNMSSELESVKQENLTLSASVSSLSDSVSGLNDSVSGLNDSVSGIEISVTDLQDTVSNLGTSVTDLQDTVSNLGTSVTDLQDKVSNIGTSVTDLQDTVSNIGTSVTDLETSVTDLQDTVSNLGTSVTDLETSVTDLETSVTDLETSVTDLQGTVSGIQTRVEELEEKGSSATQEDIESINAKIAFLLRQHVSNAPSQPNVIVSISQPSTGLREVGDVPTSITASKCWSPSYEGLPEISLQTSSSAVPEGLGSQTFTATATWGSGEVTIPVKSPADPEETLYEEKFAISAGTKTASATVTYTRRLYIVDSRGTQKSLLVKAGTTEISSLTLNGSFGSIQIKVPDLYESNEGLLETIDIQRDINGNSGVLAEVNKDLWAEKTETINGANYTTIYNRDDDEGGSDTTYKLSIPIK